MPQRVLFGQDRHTRAEGLSQGGGWGTHQDAQLRVPLQAPATDTPPSPSGGRGGWESLWKSTRCQAVP